MFSFFSFRFPESFKRELTVERQILKVKIEADEAIAEFKNCDREKLIDEILDCIHSAETALRMMNVGFIEMQKAFLRVVKKNMARGYYKRHAYTEVRDDSHE